MLYNIIVIRLRIQYFSHFYTLSHLKFSSLNYKRIESVRQKDTKC